MLKQERAWRPTTTGLAALLLCAAMLAGGYLPTPALSLDYPRAPSPPYQVPLRTIPSDDHRSTDPEAQIQEDIEGAVEVVNQYWADHWADYFLGEYEPPSISGGYEGLNGPSCNGEPARRLNAYYCSDGDYIAWDNEFFRTNYASGDNQLFPYVLIAHEWGHAVQERLDPSYSAGVRELQADCLAGLALYDAERDGTLQLEPGAGNEMAATYASIGDDTPWADPAAHGDAVDRMAAFTVGRSGNINDCVPYTGPSH
jgi:uncharacterized protein